MCMIKNQNNISQQPQRLVRIHIIIIRVQSPTHSLIHALHIIILLLLCIIVHQEREMIRRV